jgi:prophage antirepressor-like protein
MDIIKKFNVDNQTMDIRIFGDTENPLFVAKDIGKILDIKDTNSVTRDFDNDQKGLHTVNTPGGEQRLTVLTEEGLYRLLFLSRKEIAKRFQKWVYHVIRELRINGKYELEQASIKQKEEADRLIKEKEEKIERLNSFIERKHFAPRDVIYLAKMHPSRDDYIYKFGRTADERSRRQNYRGQRTEPIEFIDTYSVIDFKRAENNLKYIISPYVYTNSSEEIVQMPYELLQLAAKASVYIDRVKITIAERMKNWIPPHIESENISTLTDEDIRLADEEFLTDNIETDAENINNIEPTYNDNVKNVKLVYHENTINDELEDNKEMDKTVDTPEYMLINYEAFIEKYIVVDEKSKFTRIRLMNVIKNDFKKIIEIDNENMTNIAKEILTRLNIDKKSTTIKGYRLKNVTVDEFINQWCILDNNYRIKTTVLFHKYKTKTTDTEVKIKSSTDFLNELKYLGFKITKNTDGKFVVGVMLTRGTLEKFIEDRCEIKDDSECSCDDFISAYNAFCVEKLHIPYKRPTVRARMENLNFNARKYNNGCINFKGINIKN